MELERNRVILPTPAPPIIKRGHWWWWWWFETKCSKILLQIYLKVLKCFVRRKKVSRLITPVQTCQHEKGSLAGYWRMIAAFLAFSHKKFRHKGREICLATGCWVITHLLFFNLSAFKMVIFGISWALIRLLSTFQSTQAIKFPSDSVLKLNIANYVWILEGSLF